MKKYRIHWMAVKTKATGRGTGTYPKAQAEQIAETLNVEHKDVVVHWIEEVKE